MSNRNDTLPITAPKATSSRLFQCRVCGCTEDRACEPPCSWSEPGLCTTCAKAADAVARWMVAAMRANQRGLWREAKMLAEGR